MTDETAVPDTNGFADLGLSDELVATLGRLGYETPTPIQAQAIPTLLSGRDVVGLAQTGTGKTAAFTLPMLQRIDPAAKHVQALILAPTRELALQVSEAVDSYAQSMPGVRVLPVYGGQGYNVQLTGLKRGAHIVVGTPGRVIDHLDRGSLDLSSLEVLVLDEADEMLNMGFAEDVDRILSGTPEYKQVALFSATMPKQIRAIARKHLHDPADISTPKATTSTTTVRQRWIQVSQHHKVDALTRLLEVETGDAMLVFVRTKSATEELSQRLRARGHNAAPLNGDLVQAQRERTVSQLKAGALDIIVATDVAARGLDVDRITHVVNYDIPHDTEAYVHRIGRTGRAGRTGDAILFVTPRERRMLQAIEKVSGRPVEQMSVPTADEVNESRTSRFSQTITDSLGSPQFHAFRALVEQYANSHEASMADVAAALAVMSQDDKDFFLSPDPPKSERRERPDRAERTERTEWSERSGRTRSERPEPRDGRVAYRLAVGKRHKIGPSSVVGALANEGGLKRSDFGRITIGQDHTVVELPADLPPQVFEALARTRISGRLIDIRPDDGPPISRTREDRKPYPGKGKPAKNYPSRDHSGKGYSGTGHSDKNSSDTGSSDKTSGKDDEPRRKPRHGKS